MNLKLPVDIREGRKAYHVRDGDFLGHIWITAENGVQVTDQVSLEPSAIEAFLKFVMSGDARLARFVADAVRSIEEHNESAAGARQ